MSISKYSIASLFLVMNHDNQPLSSATGFIVESNEKMYLITNWHVLSGRNPRTGQSIDASGAIPNSLTINYLKTATGSSLEWEPVRESIVDQDEEPLWLEHPIYNRSVDVVALELECHRHYITYPYAINPPDPRIRVSVAGYLSIIGFPFGMSANGLCGIWLKGSVASEPAIDYNDLPSFLIDARTRRGQSGSPVISYSSGGSVELEDGSTALISGEIMNLQGIYSGRINEESDIGIVWKRSVIEEIISGARRGNNSFRAPTP